MATTKRGNTNKKVVVDELEPIFENAAIGNTNEKTTKIDFNEKIAVRSIAPWTVGWNKVESLGEININPYGSVRITRAEFVAGFENGNKLLCGDGNGKHATVVTEDKEIRNYLEIKEPIITKEYVKKIFDIKGLADFEVKIKDIFVTRAEKFLLLKYIKECNLNDYNKIRLCEVFCGVR